MVDELSKDRGDRVISLLSLASRAGSSREACPSEEVLAAFIGGELQGTERKTMLMHLNNCPGCYQHWLTVTAVLESDQPAAAPQLVAGSGDVSMGGSIRNALESMALVWKVAVPAIAMGLIVAIVVLLPRESDLGQDLDGLYLAQISRDDSVRQVIGGLAMPWDATTPGFSKSEQSLPVRAFAAGLWDGRAVLLNERERRSNMPAAPALFAPPSGMRWSQSQWDDYYNLGRWTLLFATQLEYAPDSVAWSAHHDLISGFQLSFSDRQEREPEAGLVLAELRKLEAILDHPIGDPQQRNDSSLRRQLNLMMQRLAL